MLEADRSRTREYVDFSKEFVMESRNFSLIFTGLPTSGKSTIAHYVEETLHLPIIQGSRLTSSSEVPDDGSLIPEDVFIESLRRRLNSEPPTGHIFDGIPRTEAQAKLLSEWARNTGKPLHVIDLSLTKDEYRDRIQHREICPHCSESYHHKIKPSQRRGVCDIDGSSLIKRKDDVDHIAQKRYEQLTSTKDQIFDVLNQGGAQFHIVDANGTMKQTSRNIFSDLSPLSFEDPELANQYFALKDFCEEEKIRFMLISGACSYIYRGRRLLKDLDILVPDQTALHKIAQFFEAPVERIESSYANSNFVNLSTGVELVSDLQVKFGSNGDSGKSAFSFLDMLPDARRVRFFGEDCMIMSPEWLIAFKLCMGRAGKDDFGSYKNDFMDASDVTVTQPINYEKIGAIAKDINAERRIREGLEILASIK